MKHVAKILVSAASVSLVSALPAIAEDGWSGEAALSAGLTTGNTETSEAGLAVDVDRASGAWNFGLQLSGDYG